MGILYFIQPAELVGTNRFKVGCSTKNDLSRVKSYKTGTRMIMILQCDDPFLLEQKVLVEFKTQFHKIAGNEYFEGDESVMRKVFYDTYIQWEHYEKDGIAKWRNCKLKEQQQRLVQLQKDLEILQSQIVQGEAYLERVMRGDEDESIIAQQKMIPIECVEKNAEKSDKHRPSSLTECFKRDTLLHHNKCGVNAYAMVCAENGLVYACDEQMNRTGDVFKSLNAFTKSNYVEKNKKEGTARSTQTNAYVELQYKNDIDVWISCDTILSGVILTVLVEREKVIIKTDRTNCLACCGSGTAYWSDDCYGSCMECCCINCEKFADECTCKDIERTVRAKLGQTYPPEIDGRGKPKHLRFDFDARDYKTPNQHNQSILNLFEEEFKYNRVTIHSGKGGITANVESEEIDMGGKGTVEILKELIEYFE